MNADFESLAYIFQEFWWLAIAVFFVTFVVKMLLDYLKR